MQIPRWWPEDKASSSCVCEGTLPEESHQGAFRNYLCKNLTEGGGAFG